MSSSLAHVKSEDPTADTIIDALLQAFPTVCNCRIRVTQISERSHKLGQGDFTAVVSIPDHQGSVLCAITVNQDTYRALIRNVFPKEVATEINADTRDLLVSVLRRCTEIVSRLFKAEQGLGVVAHPFLMEGMSHTLYVPSGVKIRELSCECDLGPITIQLARFGKEGLGVRR